MAIQNLQEQKESNEGVEIMPICYECTYCDKEFKKPHHVWFICIECHKDNQEHDEEGYGYKERLKAKLELE